MKARTVVTSWRSSRAPRPRMPSSSRARPDETTVASQPDAAILEATDRRSSNALPTAKPTPQATRPRPPSPNPNRACPMHCVRRRCRTAVSIRAYASTRSAVGSADDVWAVGAHGAGSTLRWHDVDRLQHGGRRYLEGALAP